MSLELTEQQKQFIRHGGPFPERITLIGTDRSVREVTIVDRNDSTELVPTIPHGKKGFVLKVSTASTGKKYALKICLGHDYPSDEKIDGELRAANTLPSTLFAIPEMGGRLNQSELAITSSDPWVFFLTPWVDGVTLKHFLDSGDEALTLESTIVMAGDLVEAIRELENSGLRHDDLHSENVMVTKPSGVAATERGSQSELKLRVVDTGSLKYPADLSPRKPLSDMGNVAQILTKFHNLLWNQRALVSKHPDFFERFERFINQFCDEDKSRFFAEPRDMFNAISALGSKERRDEQFEYSFSPFDALSAEHLAGDDLLRSLFVSKYPLFKVMLNQETAILEGPRGCGKSMLFRFLSAPVQVKLAPTEAMSIAPFFGVFIGCSSSLQTQLSWVGSSDQKFVRYADSAASIFQLVIVRELLGALAVASQTENGLRLYGLRVDLLGNVARRIRSLIPNLVESARFESENSAVALASDLDRLRSNINFCIVNGSIPSLLIPDNFLADTTKIITEIIEPLSRTPIVFLLDDYTTPRIAQCVQRRLSRIVFSRSPNHRFKISSEYFGTILEDDTGIRLTEQREYTIIDAADYAKTSEDTEEDDIEFLSDLLNRRLERAHWTGKIQELLGKSVFASDLELARALRTARGSTGAKPPCYSGMDTLARIWCGDIATTLHIVKIIFNEGAVDKNSTSQVDQKSQHRAISNVSKGLTARIGTQDPFGSEMSRIVTDWGNFARKCLTDAAELPSSSADSSKKQPRRLKRIEFSSDSIDSFFEDLNRDASGSCRAGDIARELIRRAIVIKKPVSRGKEGPETQTVRWELRTVLMPGFNLALKRRDEYINITSIDSFQELLLRSGDFFNKKFQNLAKPENQQKGLFEGDPQ
jgi:serine/threonine protein kinase